MDGWKDGWMDGGKEGCLHSLLITHFSLLISHYSLPQDVPRSPKTAHDPSSRPKTSPRRAPRTPQDTPQDDPIEPQVFERNFHFFMQKNRGRRYIPKTRGFGIYLRGVVFMQFSRVFRGKRLCLKSAQNVPKTCPQDAPRRSPRRPRTPPPMPRIFLEFCRALAVLFGTPQDALFRNFVLASFKFFGSFFLIKS